MLVKGTPGHHELMERTAFDYENISSAAWLHAFVVTNPLTLYAINSVNVSAGDSSQHAWSHLACDHRLTIEAWCDYVN